MSGERRRIFAEGQMNSTDGDTARRPIASRSSSWAIGLSKYLTRTGVTPNSISVMSIAFAGVGGALMFVTHPLSWLGAALCVQLRLVCNLLDGMVAIEGGKKTKTGAIYNEFPDRIADSLLLVPAGYAAGLPWLGWLSALLAALTAYIRVFGGSVGLPQDFSGIMAKQRRMAALTVGLVVQCIEAPLFGTGWSLIVACVVIAIGSLVTCATRTITVARALERS
jgi:phosphatidylglycerophosphate synthase